MDLAAAGRSLLSVDPTLGTSRLDTWSAVDADDRYPESLGFGVYASVPEEELSSFAARMALDPIPGTGS